MDEPEDPAREPAAEPTPTVRARDVWSLSFGWGLALILALAGLALALRWENVSRALDARPLFR